MLVAISGARHSNRSRKALKKRLGEIGSMPFAANFSAPNPIMSTPTSIDPEERIIVALACIIGVLFLLFAPLACKPGATGFSLSSIGKASQDKDLSDAAQAASAGASKENASEAQLNKASSAMVASNDLKTQTPPPQAYYNQPRPSSSNNLTEAAFVGAIANTDPTGSRANRNSTVDTEQAALAAAERQRMTEEYLNQIETLAAESNELKEERRERILQLAETKKEYAATLKFAQEQNQEKLRALEIENKILADKLAAQGGTEETESPEEPGFPQNPDGSDESETPADGEMPSQTPSPTSQENQNTEAPAFAESDDDLDESRRSLVNAIREMDPLSGDALDSRYQELESELGTKSAGRINFVSGSSKANDTELTKIDKLVTDSKDDSQFLIVGFADKSGSAAGNRRLSSNRAKFVAEQLGKKVGNGRVQAIYLGQTARFGRSAENRVVEIWEVPATPPKK